MIRYSLVHFVGIEDGAPSLVDLSGKVALKTEVREQSVDMSSVYRGVYLVQIRSRNKVLRMKVKK